MIFNRCFTLYNYYKLCIALGVYDEFGHAPTVATLASQDGKTRWSARIGAGFLRGKTGGKGGAGAIATATRRRRALDSDLSRRNDARRGVDGPTAPAARATRGCVTARTAGLRVRGN